MGNTDMPRRSYSVVMLRAFQTNYKPVIYAKENCVLVCRGACIIFAATQKGKNDYKLRLNILWDHELAFCDGDALTKWLPSQSAMRHSDYYFQDSYRYARINQPKSTHSRNK